MNIYRHKFQNIAKTWALFSAFLIIVIGLGWLFARIYADPGILIIAVIFSSAMALGSYWFSDKLVLAMMRAEPVSRQNAPELYAMVEKLAAAANLPLPKIYIVQEAAPNAFATGRNTKHAAVAVTTGLLQRLNAKELEGVIAHELSHIGNRDMLISTAAVVLVGFISILSDMFMRSMLWGGFRRDRRDGASGVILILGLIASILAPLAAMLMRLAISRKREFLADASGAAITKNPEGLASALEKISRDPTPLRSAQNTTAHLWIEDPFKGRPKTSFIHKLFMSHPPIEERIKILRELKY